MPPTARSCFSYGDSVLDVASDVRVAGFINGGDSAVGLGGHNLPGIRYYPGRGLEARQGTALQFGACCSRRRSAAVYDVLADPDPAS